MQKPVERLDIWLSGSLERSGRDEPAWLAWERLLAREQLHREAVPGLRQEGWRYSNLRTLLEQRFRPVEQVIGAPGEIEPGTHLVPGLDAWRVVLVNGCHVPGLSRLDGLPPGVKAESLQRLLRREPEWVEQRLNSIVGRAPMSSPPSTPRGCRTVSYRMRRRTLIWKGRWS